MFPFTVPFLLLLFSSLWWFIPRRKPPNCHRKLSHGPRPLPIIGSLHLLGTLPHRAFNNLAKTYDPIMSMRLRSIPAIIVSSPEAAELFLKTHDAVFASRTKIQAVEYVSYGSKGVAFTQYGSYWRSVRKFCTLELLITTKIDSFSRMRRQERGLLVAAIRGAVVAREMVDVSEKVGGVIENMTYRMMFGRSRDERFDLKGEMKELMDLARAFNVSDYVPFPGPTQ